jgi:hypothetical protein
MSPTIDQDLSSEFADRFNCRDDQMYLLSRYVCALESAIEDLHARVRKLESTQSIGAQEAQ